MVLCFPHKRDLHFLVNPFFGIWLFLFAIPWKDTMSLCHVIYKNHSAVHFRYCTIFVVMLNLEEKLHDLGHLVVIRINSDNREHSVFQILWSVHQFNGRRWWDEQAQIKKKEQNIFIATSFSVLISLFSCRYAPHDIEQQGHLTRELRSASLEIKLSAAILSSGVFFLNLLLIGS